MINAVPARTWPLRVQTLDGADVGPLGDVHRLTGRLTQHLVEARQPRTAADHHDPAPR